MSTETNRPGTDDGGRDAELEALRQALDRQLAIARREAVTAREIEEDLRRTRADLKASDRTLRALRARRSVRLGVALADRSRAGVRLLGSLGARIDPRSIAAARSVRRRLEASGADEARFLERSRARELPRATRSGPLVSIVMLNRDGASHLRRCLPALASVAYRDVELIVVDNGSTDGSIDIVEGFRPGFPVRTIRNVANASFSAGNNQGLAEARGELVLFLNNDIEPIDPDWLGRMVETIDEPDVAAVGARLVYPRRTGEVRSGLGFADLSLQHGGVGFAMVDGVPLPLPLGAGEDALSDWATAVRDVPALTAACLLVRRDVLVAVGGFATGYDYGLEDVDLCLTLRSRGGRLVYDGRVALWHHESATRTRDDVAVRRERNTANRELFVGTWATRTYRTVMLDSLRGGHGWRLDPVRIGLEPSRAEAGEPVAAGGARPSPDDFAGLGWQVEPVDPSGDVDPSFDVLVSIDARRDVRALPAGIIRVAWIRSASEAATSQARLPDYDIVLAESPAAARETERLTGHRAALFDAPSAEALASALESWVAATRFAVRIAVPSWDVAESWGDLHFARGLQRALRRLDHPTRIQIGTEWAGHAAARDDVTILVLGIREGPTRTGQLNVLWQISHPDLASPELYERHDQVFVASDGFARWMAARVKVPVAPLHQATDPERFLPEPTGPAHQLLLVANTRGVRRHILDDLLPTDRELAVYGRGWTANRLEPRFLAGDGVPNDELGGFYAAAAIVLNDHWPDMQREGFLSNRLYDASAAGGFVISDEVDGLEAEFDAGVVAYRDAAHLRALIDHYLAHPEERRARAARARQAVLERHTFAHRARELVDALGPALADRRKVV